MTRAPPKPRYQLFTGTRKYSVEMTEWFAVRVHEAQVVSTMSLDSWLEMAYKARKVAEQSLDIMVLGEQ